MKPEPQGLTHPGVIDTVAHDPTTDEAVLIMYETRPWEGSQEQWLQLQEKTNTYLSFALDGEMTEAYPAFAAKRVRIQLNTIHEPDAGAWKLIDMFKAALPERISFEVCVPTHSSVHKSGHRS